MLKWKVSESLSYTNVFSHCCLYSHDGMTSETEHISVWTCGHSLTFRATCYTKAWNSLYFEKTLAHSSTSQHYIEDIQECTLCFQSKLTVTSFSLTDTSVILLLLPKYTLFDNDSSVTANVTSIFWNWRLYVYVMHVISRRVWTSSLVLYGKDYIMGVCRDENKRLFAVRSIVLA